jgi:nicotinamide mononucleotide transporter
LFSDLFHWLQENPDLIIEGLGVITALIYLFFSIRQKIWLWPFGILTSSFYIYVFFKGRLYADMGLQVYYLIISFYGWYFWIFGAKGQDKLKLTVLNRRLTIILLILTFVIYWILVLALKILPSLLEILPSDLLYWDAFTTAASIIATWMLARKIIEQWLVWILVDMVSMGLYLYKGLYLTAGLFLIYTVLAFVGYWQWKKELK